MKYIKTKNLQKQQLSAETAAGGPAPPKQAVGTAEMPPAVGGYIPSVIPEIGLYLVAIC